MADHNRIEILGSWHSGTEPYCFRALGGLTYGGIICCPTLSGANGTARLQVINHRSDRCLVLYPSRKPKQSKQDTKEQ